MERWRPLLTTMKGWAVSATRAWNPPFPTFGPRPLSSWSWTGQIIRWIIAKNSRGETMFHKVSLKHLQFLFFQVYIGSNLTAVARLAQESETAWIYTQVAHQMTIWRLGQKSPCPWRDPTFLCILWFYFAVLGQFFGFCWGGGWAWVNFDILHFLRFCTFLHFLPFFGIVLVLVDIWIFWEYWWVMR